MINLKTQLRSIKTILKFLSRPLDKAINGLAPPPPQFMFGAMIVYAAFASQSLPSFCVTGAIALIIVRDGILLKYLHLPWL
jgi:hypothetical protein